MSSVAAQADHDGHPVRAQRVDGGKDEARAVRAARPAAVVAAVIALHVLALAMLTREVPPRNETIDVNVLNAVLVSRQAASERNEIPAPVQHSQHDATRPAVLPHAQRSPTREPKSRRANVAAPPPSSDAAESVRPAPDRSQTPTNSQPGRTDANANRPSPATPQIAPPAAPSSTPPVAPPVATPRRVAHLDCALVKPDYPPQSLRRGEAGTAVVELDTDVAGRVSAARVVTSSGSVHLDEAARGAVLASHCRPYSEDGTPVPARADVPVTFNLDE